MPLYVLGAFGTMNFDTSTDPWWPKLWSTGALVMIVGAVLIAAATAAAAAIAGLGMAHADAVPVVVLLAMGGAALLVVLAIVGYRHRRRAT